MAKHLETFSLSIEQAEQDTRQKTSWIKLLPENQFMACDGRGPFYANAEALVAAWDGIKMPIDLDHAIDDPYPNYATKGRSYGWIVKLEAREDGLWGFVEWTKKGQELLEEKAYGFISPVFYIDEADDNGVSPVAQVLRAALCNNPALRQLPSLFKNNDLWTASSSALANGHVLSPQGEHKMDKELVEALGLNEAATSKEAITKVEALKTQAEANAQSFKASKQLCSLTGLKAQNDGTLDTLQLVEKFQQVQEANLKANATITALNAQISEQKLTSLQQQAEAFVNQAMEEGKIAPVLRDHYIERFVKEPEMVKKELAYFTSINAGGFTTPPEKTTGLNAAEKEMCQAMGLDESQFVKTKGQKEA